MIAGGRGASVSACADLTNQLQCCWVDPACAWIKHWHSNCRLPVDGGGVDTTPCTVNWCKKVRSAWLASSYCMGFQNFVVSNKIHPFFKKYVVETYFFPAHFTSFHTHASLLTVFICTLILFHSCCSCCCIVFYSCSCISFPFPIAVLNGTLFFRENKWSKSLLSKPNYYIYCDTMSMVGD